MAPETVGKRLKKLRELAGVPQAAVAAHMGFDRAFLSMVESGYRNLSTEDVQKVELFLQHQQARKTSEFALVRMAAV